MNSTFKLQKVLTPRIEISKHPAAPAIALCDGWEPVEGN